MILFFRKKSLIAVLFATLMLLMPLSFLFAAVNAGVVNGVWFSKANPKEGETIQIFTAVQNQSTEKITGSVVFLVNGDIIGTKKFAVAPNDVIPVSIGYTFLGGEHDVSAYIASVEDQIVAYTIATQSSVSVASSETQPTQTQQKNILESSSPSEALNTITQTTKKVTNNIEPITQKTANRIEEFRDTLLSDSPILTVVNSDNADTQSSTQKEPTKKEATQDFLKDSKTIATATDINLWKKVAGVLLSLLALFVRLWFIFVIVFVVFIFWRLVRGQRIR